MPRLTLVTNFEYVAQGRQYCLEDLWLAAALRKRGFAVVTIHPNDLAEKDFAGSDAVLWRNTGAVVGHKPSLAKWKQYQAEGKDGGKLANNLQLKGDLCGKQHLINLTQLGSAFPVIPTQLVGSFLALNEGLPEADADDDQRVLIKPMDGADSFGLEMLTVHELRQKATAAPEKYNEGYVTQRVVDFEYEVSFYFVGATLVHALRTGTERWKMAPYTEEGNCSTWEADVALARKFNEWNGLSRGVVRVDGVRERETGQLLLMEIEDYNPYLSLDLISEAAREGFVDTLARSICGE